MLDNINVKFPKAWLVYFGSMDKVEEEARKAVVLEWVRTHKISQGKGAELLGMNRWDFYKLLGQYNVPTVDVTVEELEEGSVNLKRAMESGR